MQKWARTLIIGMRLNRQDCSVLYIYLDSWTHQKNNLIFESQNGG